MQDTLEEKFGAFECEIGGVEVQWKNKEKGAVDTTSDLLVKVERGGKKSQEVISKMDGGRKWKDVYKTKKKGKTTEKR